MRDDPRRRQRDDRRREAARRPVRARAQARSGDCASASCVPAQPARGGLRHLRRGRADAAQVRVDLALPLHARARASRRRRGRRPRPVHGDDGRRSASAAPTRSSSRPSRRRSSGWLRRDLIERIRDATGLPVEHVVDRPRRTRACPSTSRSSSPTGPPAATELLERLREKDAGGRARRRCSSSSCPQEGGERRRDRRAARARLGSAARPAARATGLLAPGMIGDPDPYTATMNALQFFTRRRRRHLDAARASARAGCAPTSSSASARRRTSHGRARRRRARRRRDGGLSADQMEAAALAHSHARRPGHHGPPAANRSSRVEPQILGMLLFIISEIMVFGAFFTAYFFIRVVHGDQWFPVDGIELPVAVAGVNTAILSQLVAHDALGADVDQERQPRGLKAGIVLDLPARPDVPLHPDQRVRPHRLRAAGLRPGDDLLRPHRPARRARVRRPDAAADRHGPRVPRPLLARASTTASRCPGSTGTSSTSCGSSSTRRSTSSDAHQGPAALRAGGCSASCSGSWPSWRCSSWWCWSCGRSPSLADAPRPHLAVSAIRRGNVDEVCRTSGTSLGPPPSVACERRVRIEVGGRRRRRLGGGAVRARDSHPPTLYVPPADVRADLLVASDARGTTCEFKGRADYLDSWSTGTGADRSPGPIRTRGRATRRSRGTSSFYPGRVDAAWLGDERVTAQEGGVYKGLDHAGSRRAVQGPGRHLGW